MRLSQFTLKNITAVQVTVPDAAIFDLPEKVLQFGTGVLLRGLPDYFIDKANREGNFNGRIVVVKSTAHGDTQAFDKQDGLYTLCIRGLEEGQRVEENIVNASISRVLSATEEWGKILECAHSQHMQVIISNTTEVGIQLIQDDVRHHPPKSFPGKLLAFLYERFKAFSGSAISGMVIVPTELIPDNGKKLEAIVLELAHLNGLEESFIEWLETCNHFCNSLVDCIVTGKPEESDQAALEQVFGYTDELMTMSETYRLWAIEGGQHVKEVLSFANSHTGVIIEPDIELYRELKLRLLNGTHTLSCGLAFLAGCETVKQAMDNELVVTYLTQLMQEELSPAIPYELDIETAQAFGRKVLDRFRNPHINHLWLNITVQYSSKMKMRCLPLLKNHYKQTDAVPERMAIGFAAYLLFMKSALKTEGKFFGEFNGTQYQSQDDQAAVFHKRWGSQAPTGVVKETLRDIAFWGSDLSLLPGFQDAVLHHLRLMIDGGVKVSLEHTQTKKAVA
ncbi:MAG TPA: tagaturonate reductase [Flavisolibacter sp.]|nr:tagaturonate reductase [Flavisolibacter sp.]